MIGHLAGTLALSKPKMVLSVYHGAILFAGGSRRVRPVYCRRAIHSFPLHQFYQDPFAIEAFVQSLSFQDVVLQASSKESFKVSFNVPFLTLADSVKSPNITSDSFATAFSVLSVVLTDAVKQHSYLDSFGVQAGVVSGGISLIDNVKITSNSDSFSVQAGVSGLSLEAP